MPHAFITGIDGFAGRYLTELLLASGDRVSGLVRGPAPLPGFTSSEAFKVVTLHTGDLLDAAALKRALKAAAPDEVYHLAGWASAGQSLLDPVNAFSVNSLGTLNVLESLRSFGYRGRALVVSSAEVYGIRAPAHGPCDEDTGLAPTTPYAAGKAAADLVARQYHLSWDMDIVRVRPFNHTGPRQSPHFVCPDFARQVATIEAGQQAPVMRVGNLESVRDFSHVADIVAGYKLAMRQGVPGEVYNLGLGRGRSIREVLDHLLSRARCPIRVEQESARLRSSDVPYLVADARRARQDLGWQPRHTVEEALDGLLEEWRSIARTG